MKKQKHSIIILAALLVAACGGDQPIPPDYSIPEIYAFKQELSTPTQQSVERMEALRKDYGKRPTRFLLETAADDTKDVQVRAFPLGWASFVDGERAAVWLKAYIERPVLGEISNTGFEMLCHAVHCLGTTRQDEALEFLKKLMHEEYWETRQPFVVLRHGSAPPVRFEETARKLRDAAFYAFGNSGTWKVLRDLESGKGIPEFYMRCEGRESWLRTLRKKLIEGDKRSMGELIWEDYYEHEAPKFRKNDPITHPEPNGDFEYLPPVEEKKP